MTPEHSAHCRDDAAYVLGALSPADRRAYEEHLRDCVACQSSVRSLAGLPGLLALTTEDAIAAVDAPPPPTLLPGLLTRVERDRRRRARWAGLAAAAAAVLVLAFVWSVVRPPDPGPSAGPASSSESSPATPPASVPPSASAVPLPDETVELDQVMPGPMTATLELADRRWGTAITVICRYDAAMTRTVAYDLAVFDTDGNETSAGSWSGLPGVTARIPVATAVPRDHILSFEVRLPDGRTILRGAP